MLEAPATEAEFDALVPDEVAAEKILVGIRWPDGVACAQCGSRRVTRLTTRAVWQCRVCRAQTSVRSGTVLHRTRAPLRDWLYCAWVCSTSWGASARSVALRLGRRYETVWVMLHKLRASLAERTVWQLAGAVFLGAGALKVTKRSREDRDLREPVVAAIAVAEDLPEAPGHDDLRILTASRADLPDDALLDEARVAHIEITAEVLREPGRMGSTVGNRAPWELANTYRAVRSWLHLRFRGVSRRYCANYLAQFVYVRNRRMSGPRRFEWVARRLMWEPWRSRASVALPAP